MQTPLFSPIFSILYYNNSPIGPQRTRYRPKIPMNRVLNEMPEAFVSRTSISRAVSRAVKAGETTKARFPPLHQQPG